MGFFNVTIKTFVLQDNDSNEHFQQIKAMRKQYIPYLKDDHAEDHWDQHSILFLALVDSKPAGSLRMILKKEKSAMSEANAEDVPMELEVGLGEFSHDVGIFCDAFQNRQCGELSKLVVAKDYRRSNLVCELTSAAIKESIKAGCSFIVCERLLDNYFYRIMGFRDTGIIHARKISGSTYLPKFQLQYMYLGLQESRQRQYALEYFNSISEMAKDEKKFNYAYQTAIKYIKKGESCDLVYDCFKYDEDLCARLLSLYPTPKPASIFNFFKSSTVSKSPGESVSAGENTTKSCCVIL